MCEHCMDKTTEMLFTQTGITENAIEWFDALVIAAINVGYQMALEDQKPEAEQQALVGDPLREVKTPLVKYIADLEKLATGLKVDLSAMIPPPPVPLGPMSDLVS